MSIMLILHGVQDRDYARQRAFDTCSCESGGAAIAAINADEDGEISAVYGPGDSVGLVIDALDNYSKARIRLIVVQGNPKDEPAWQFNGPWELVYRG